MISAIALQEVAQKVGVPSPSQSISFERVRTDSRRIEKGDLYVAIKGERFDGNNFVAEVEEAGACAAVVSREESKSALPQLVVDNTLEALADIARLNREKFSKPVVGVTGSCGKTTVKEMIAAILTVTGSVLATRGNLNNHIGLPLMLLELNGGHDFAVLEMGASAMGEIAYLADIARPDVVLVNNVAPAHVEGFGSVDNIAKAKGEIYESLGSEGFAVVNLDDHYARLWLEQNKNRKVLTFSAQKPASVEAANIKEYEQGYSGFDLNTHEGSVSVLLPLVGQHNVMNALAAASCCVALGIPLQQIQQGLENVSAVSGRGEVKAGIKNSKVIDDTYNANPSAVKAAMDVLSSQKGIKVFVLGDMGELGQEENELHAEVGEYAKGKDIQMLLTVGVLSENASAAFNGQRQGRHFQDKQELIEFCQGLADKDVVFLCKGSRSARMEEVVDGLIEASNSGETA